MDGEPPDGRRINAKKPGADTSGFRDRQHIAAHNSECLESYSDDPNYYAAPAGATVRRASRPSPGVADRRSPERRVGGRVVSRRDRRSTRHRKPAWDDDWAFFECAPARSYRVRYATVSEMHEIMVLGGVPDAPIGGVFFTVVRCDRPDMLVKKVGVTLNRKHIGVGEVHAHALWLIAEAGGCEAYRAVAAAGRGLFH